ncbi:mitochondrial carrier domain-containing protein [Aspergillus crustosus]
MANAISSTRLFEVKPTTPPFDINYPRWFGCSASSMAVLCSHPFDLVQMQAAAKHTQDGFIGISGRILRIEGTRGPYHGVNTPLDIVTYGTTRIALYEELKQSATSTGTPPSGSNLITMSALSGFIGAIFSMPLDIANIRMQNDRTLPPQLPACDRCLAADEPGAGRLYFAGSGPIVSGRALLTAIGGRTETAAMHILAFIGASLVATTLCSLMDVIRTQLMSSSTRVSVLRAIGDLSRSQGYSWIFRVWTPSFVRLGPQTVATQVFLEQHRRIYRVLQGI